MKRLLLIALALTLASGQALAVFSPGLNKLSGAYEAGTVLSLEAAARLEEWQGVSPRTQDAFKSWLQNAALRLLFGRETGRETWSLRLLLDGKALMSGSEVKEAGFSTLQLTPPGKAYRGKVTSPPLSLLTDETVKPEWGSVLLGELSNSLQAALPDIWVKLGAYEKRVKEGLSIPHVGRGSERAAYRLSAEEWNAARPDIVGLLLAALDAPLRFAPVLKSKAENFINSLRFEGPGTLERVFDKDGLEIGWRFTGNLSTQGEDIRRVTLTCGFKEGSGLWLSMKAPALKGRDSLTLQISAQHGEKKGTRSWDAGLALTARNGGESLHLKGSAALKSMDGENGEALKGVITLSAGDTPQDSAKATLKLTPDLVFDGTGARGSIGFSRQKGRDTLRSLVFDIALTPGNPPTTAAAEDTLWLDGADSEGLAEAREDFRLGLLPIMRELMMMTPTDDRRAVLHDLGREERTAGDSVPVMDDSPGAAEDYVVVDITTKEDIP